MGKICVVTASRAEYGVLVNILKAINNKDNLELQLVVTGTHLLKEYGYTIDEIIKDGFTIDKEINIIDNTESARDISNIIGNAAIKFGKYFENNKPDLLLVVGDRYELLGICEAALVTGINIAHISGGEITEGAIDDNIRHCITKMSTLHFPACEEYRHRIIQLGEQPNRVFNYGDPGVENVQKMNYMSQQELEEELNISLNKCICLTFHPTTNQINNLQIQVKELLDALDQYPDITFVASKSNADLGGKYINEEFEAYQTQHANFHLFDSLGARRYISIIKLSQVVLGNSSSGIIEAPALHIPTVNIGERQSGRLMARSIICCENSKMSIINAINKAMSKEFKEEALSASSLYGDGDVSKKIVDEIEAYVNGNHTDSIKKFYDIEFKL